MICANASFSQLGTWMPKRGITFLKVRCLITTELGSEPMPSVGKFSVCFLLLHFPAHTLSPCGLLNPSSISPWGHMDLDFLTCVLLFYHLPQPPFSCIFFCLYFPDNSAFWYSFSFLLPSLFSTYNQLSIYIVTSYWETLPEGIFIL